MPQKILDQHGKPIKRNLKKAFDWKSPFFLVPVSYLASTAIFTFALHSYLGGQAEKWIHTFKREAYLVNSLIESETIDPDKATSTLTALTNQQPNSSDQESNLSQYIENTTLQRLYQGINTSDTSSVANTQSIINSCFFLYKELNSSDFNSSPSLKYEHLSDLFGQTPPIVGTPQDNAAQKPNSEGKASTNADNVTHSTHVDATTEVQESIRENCPSYFTTFKQADIYNNQAYRLYQDLVETKEELDSWQKISFNNIFNHSQEEYLEIQKERLLYNLEMLLVLPAFNAAEVEKINLIKKYDQVIARQNELYKRLIFNYKWNSSIVSILNLSGLIALFCFLIGNSNIFGFDFHNVGNDDSKKGKNPHKVQQKKLLTALFATSMFFLGLSYLSHKTFMVEVNLQDSLNRYKEYVALENSIYTFISTGGITNEKNEFEKPEVNRFIQYVDNQLKTLNQYSLMTDSSIAESRFGGLLGMLDSSSLGSPIDSPVPAGDVPDKSVTNLVSRLDEVLKKIDEQGHSKATDADEKNSDTSAGNN